MNKTSVLQDLLLELASDAGDDQLLAAIQALRSRVGATKPEAKQRSGNGTGRTRHPTQFLITEALKALGRPSYLAEIVKEVRKREKGLGYQAVSSTLSVMKKAGRVCYEERSGISIYWAKPEGS